MRSRSHRSRKDPIAPIRSYLLHTNAYASLLAPTIRSTRLSLGTVHTRTRIRRRAEAQPRIQAVSTSPVWWGYSRRALPLDAFRVVTGTLLGIHFAECAHDVPGLIQDGSLFDPTLLIGAVPGSSATLLSFATVPAAAEGILDLAVLLALGVGVGYRPRLCSGLLFVIAVSTYRAIYPVTDWDDMVANLLSFWLVLLPIGNTLKLNSSRSSPSHWSTARIPGTTLTLFLAQLLVAYLCPPLWQHLKPSTDTKLWIAPFILIPVLYIAPGVVPRVLGFVTQWVVHINWLMRDGLFLLHGVLLAGSVLLVGERPTLGPGRTATRLNAFGTIGAIQFFLTLLYTTSVAVGMSSLHRATRKVLGDIGTAPAASGQKPSSDDTYVEAGPSAKRNEWRLEPGLRSRMISSYLSPSDATARMWRKSIGIRLARRYCRQAGHSDEVASIWLKSNQLRHEVVRFICRDENEFPEMLDITPTSAGRSQ